MKIFKYALETKDIQTVELPRGARILTVKKQYGKLCLWAEVSETVEDTYEAEIRVIGTGNPIKIDLDKFNHIDTVVTDMYVWHIYICGRDLRDSFYLKNEGRSFEGQ